MDRWLGDPTSVRRSVVVSVVSLCVAIPLISWFVATMVMRAIHAERTEIRYP